MKKFFMALSVIIFLMCIPGCGGCYQQPVVYQQPMGAQPIVDDWQAPMGTGYVQPGGAIHYSNGYYDAFGMWHYQHSFHPIVTAMLWAHAAPAYYNPRTNITIYNGQNYSGNQVRTYLSKDRNTSSRFNTRDASKYTPSTFSQQRTYNNSKPAATSSGSSFSTQRSYSTPAPATKPASSGSSFSTQRSSSSFSSPSRSSSSSFGSSRSSSSSSSFSSGRRR